MKLTHRTRGVLRIVGWIVVGSGIVGAIVAGLRVDEPNVVDALQGAAIGCLIGLGCSAAELLLLSNPSVRLARRLPIIALSLLRAALFSAVILIGLTIPRVAAGEPPPWETAGFGLDFAVSAAIAVIISVGVEITRLLGRETALALATSRYHRPRLEERVILFADLVGSTAAAERIGDLRFHELLSEVAQDLAEPIEAAGGDVHRYVGDAVIVTWPIAKGVRRAACLECALGMGRALAARAGVYRQAFGLAPAIRVAVHCGEVAAGEIGDWKKEIALLGDTMNTTARIEGAARANGVDVVLSDAVARRLPEDARARLRPLPPFAAAGKREALTLWTVMAEAFPPDAGAANDEGA